MVGAGVVVVEAPAEVGAVLGVVVVTVVLIVVLVEARGTFVAGAFPLTRCKVASLMIP